MKKYFTLFVLLITMIHGSNAQAIAEKKYYRQADGTNQVDKKKARYEELIIKEPDGTITYERRKIGDDQIVRLRSFKDDFPVGEWITSNGEKLNYNFELQYGDDDCEGVVYYDLLEKMIYTPIVGLYKPPVFPFEDDNFRKYVVRRLRFPAASYEKGVQGKTLFKFVIDESGCLVNLIVIESADKTLDKEAARIILQAPKWKPATIDGKPLKVCTKMGVIFSFQSF